MKSIKLSLLLMVLTIIVFACKKETETPTPNPAPTKAEILSSGKWLPSTVIVTPPIELDGNMVSNITSYIRPCELDNYYTFSKSKTYIYSNGTLKCDSNENAIQSKGTWFLTTGEKYLVLNNEDTNNSDSLYLTFFSKDSLVYKTNTKFEGKIHELKRTIVKK